MKMTFLTTIGLPVISHQAEGPVALMKEPLINPEDGGILAVSLVGMKHVISVHDITKWDLEGIKITDETAIINRNELIKLSVFSPGSTQIFGKEVVKEDGTYLGMVHDFVFDTEVGQLVQIYVVKKFLIFFVTEKRIIDYREIVEITEDAIIVKDDLQGKKESIREFLELRDQVKIKMPTNA